MNKVIRTMVISTLAVVATVVLMGATKGDPISKGKVGVVAVPGYDGGTLALDGGTNPVKMFTGLPGRNAFNVFNNGPRTIWCDWKNTVTPSTGYPIPAGASLGVDIVFNSSAQDFYCTASFGPDQYTPSDSRWIQVE